MKKILLLLTSIILLASCEESVATEHFRRSSTYLDINGCEYYKINIGGHDCYQYTFHIRNGIGSDILHLEDLCEKCKTLKKVN